MKSNESLFLYKTFVTSRTDHETSLLWICCSQNIRYKYSMVSRSVGSIKRLGGGGTGFQGHFWILKRAPKTFSPEMFPVIPYQNCMFLTKLFFKTSKFPNKKGAFDVNLVFTATLACTKRALFITKKGNFNPLKKWGGTCPLCPPGSYAPGGISLLQQKFSDKTFFQSSHIKLQWKI